MIREVELYRARDVEPMEEWEEDGGVMFTSEVISLRERIFAVGKRCWRKTQKHMKQGGHTERGRRVRRVLRLREWSRPASGRPRVSRTGRQRGDVRYVGDS